MSFMLYASNETGKSLAGLPPDGSGMFGLVMGSARIRLVSEAAKRWVGRAVQFEREADVQVRNIMGCQSGDGCLGSYIRERRISRLAAQFLLKSEGGLIPGFEHVVVCQENRQLLMVAGHPLVCGFQAGEAGKPLGGVALLLVEAFAYAFAIGKIAMPPAERVEVAALEAAWRAGVGVRDE